MPPSLDTPKPGELADTLGAVILAAGKSARMGRPKLLLPWGSTSVLGHLLAQWQALGARQIAVVCAADDQVVQGELDRLGFPAANRICNLAPERGMFSSIQCAAQWPGWKAGLTRRAIVLGDQPLVRSETLRGLLGFSAAHPELICQPARAGHGRHPVLLPQATFLALAGSTAPTLKEFLHTRATEMAFYPVDDPGLEVDMDRPEDYEKALKLAVKEELNPYAIPLSIKQTNYEPG
jgi:molybdenum cofactor cytidylyltransferase